MTAFRRCIIILLTVLLTFTSLPVTATQPDSTTRLMLSHEARLTAEIPAGWGLDRMQNAEYISPDGQGFIVTTAYPASITSLTQACESATSIFDAQDQPERAITWITFQGQIACRLDAPDATGAGDEPVALIFMHPNPLRSSIDNGAYFKYVGVMVDRADFDNVIDSIDFSLDNVTPELYLDAALDIIETHTFVRDEIDWPSVREAAADSIVDGDTLLGVDIALQALEDAGDNHSYRWDATQLDTYVDTDAEDIPLTQLPAGTALTGRIGYINLPPIQGDSSVSELYATTGNTAIADVDTPTTCGWVIDLRSNFGGNSDPMIAAIGEILGEGIFGGFAYSDGTTSFRAYQDGSVYPVEADDDSSASLITGPVYRAENPTAAVAVLIGPLTGSAGEYTAIAFHGRDNVQYFGEASADLTTGISGYLLADGAALGLATSAMIDRNGATFPDGIEPDVVVESDDQSIGDPNDPVIATAIDWLTDQPPCA